MAASRTSTRFWADRALLAVLALALALAAVLTLTAAPAAARGAPGPPPACLTKPDASCPTARTPAADPSAPAATAPAVSTPSPAQEGDGTDGSGYADPGRALGASSPSCKLALDAAARARCRQSGSITRRHPLSSYGIDARVGFSLTDPGKSFLGALQSLAAGLWTGLVYLVDAVLLLLEWAFSLDLTATTLPKIHGALTRLHQQAFGEPWLLAAISLTGLWGIWRGLVQRQHTQTITALAATIGLMVLGLFIVSAPEQTVGKASALANDAGTGILAAATTGRPDQPRTALAAALAGTFNILIADPWCALEFGSLDYCHQKTKSGATTAGLWLKYPAQSAERGELYKLVKGDQGGGSLLDPLRIVTTGTPLALLNLPGPQQHKLPGGIRDQVEKAPVRVELQEAGGTFPRFALLAVIAVGTLGALGLLGYIAVRLLLASLLTLLLLLLAPVMLLAPAFGDSGRQTFLAWIKRLVGAIAAKLLYAVFLAIVLASARALASVGIGWFGTWLLLAAFWWGVLLKRDELIGFASAGLPHHQEGSVRGTLAQGYYAWQLGRGAAALVTGAAAGPVALAAAARARSGEQRTARTAAISGLAREHLDHAATRAIGAEQQTAGALIAGRPGAERDLRSINRHLQRHDDAVVTARATGGAPPKPTAQQQQLIAHRERLQAVLEDPGMHAAEEITRHAQRNRALSGAPITARDLAAHQDARRREHQTLPPDHERHLRAAGVDPHEYRAAPVERQAQLTAHVDEHLRRERALLDAAAPPSGTASGASVEQAVAHLRSDELDARTRAERQRLRDERRRQRGRTGIYR